MPTPSTPPSRCAGRSSASATTNCARNSSISRCRSRSGLEHKHVGSLHAADARMAIEHARDVYTRRQEGVSIWVLRSADIIASDPEEADALFEPARDKVYRHPTFYAIPEEVKNL